MTLGRYDRRGFLALAGSAAAAAVAAACGDDGEKGGGTPAAGVTPLAAASPTITAGTDAGVVALRWFGQSMFLLTSPGGTTVLLDPFNDIGYAVPPPLDADAATITHEHPDHNNGALGGTTARLLRGLTPDGGWAAIDENAGDVHIRSVPTYHDGTLGSERGRNATFLFETGGLRIAHFGDLGHALENVQITLLGGPVDVAMVPVGGLFTIDAAAATEVIAQVKAKIVFPMHYKTDEIAFPLATVDDFLVGKTVERVGSTTIRFSKAELPADTTTMVLDYE